MSDEEASNTPSDNQSQAKDHSNEIFVRRKIVWALRKLIYVWLIGCAIWISQHQDDGHGSMMRVILWSVLIFPAFLTMAYFGAWRCPECNAYLGRSSKVTLCKKCGLDLDAGRE